MQQDAWGCFSKQTDEVLKKLCLWIMQEKKWLTNFSHVAALDIFKLSVATHISHVQKLQRTLVVFIGIWAHFSGANVLQSTWLWRPIWLGVEQGQPSWFHLLVADEHCELTVCQIGPVGTPVSRCRRCNWWAQWKVCNVKFQLQSSISIYMQRWEDKSYLWHNSLYMTFTDVIQGAMLVNWHNE